jgi:hypothetical protein
MPPSRNWFENTPTERNEAWPLRTANAVPIWQAPPGRARARLAPGPALHPPGLTGRLRQLGTKVWHDLGVGHPSQHGSSSTIQPARSLPASLLASSAKRHAASIFGLTRRAASGRAAHSRSRARWNGHQRFLRPGVNAGTDQPPCTTVTGQGAWCRTARLTEPSLISRRPPRPRAPSTSNWPCDAAARSAARGAPCSTRFCTSTSG